MEVVSYQDQQVMMHQEEPVAVQETTDLGIELMDKAGDEEKPWQELFRRVRQGKKKKARNRMSKKKWGLLPLQKVTERYEQAFFRETTSPKMCQIELAEKHLCIPILS